MERTRELELGKRKKEEEQQGRGNGAKSDRPDLGELYISVILTAINYLKGKVGERQRQREMVAYRRKAVTFPFCLSFSNLPYVFMRFP